MSMFEIYNETLRDLLAADKDGTKLEIKQTASGMQVGLVPTHCYHPDTARRSACFKP